MSMALFQYNFIKTTATKTKNKTKNKKKTQNNDGPQFADPWPSCSSAGPGLEIQPPEPDFHVPPAVFCDFLLLSSSSFTLARRVFLFTAVTEDHGHIAPDAKESRSFQNNPYPIADLRRRYCLSEGTRTKTTTWSLQLCPTNQQSSSANHLPPSCR